MSEPLKIYMRQCLIGFGLSAVFVGLLLAFNVVNLWTLISGSDVGLLAAFLLWFFTGIVLAGAQFGIYVMSLTEDDDTRPSGRGPGVRDRAVVPVPADRPKTPISRFLKR